MATTQSPSQVPSDLIASILTGLLGFETETGRGRDALDFKSLHVDIVADALRVAYEAGAAASAAPACGGCGRVFSASEILEYRVDCNGADDHGYPRFCEACCG